MKTALELKKELFDGQYDDVLMNLYVDHEWLEGQRQRYAKAIDTFVTHFGDHEVAVFSTPGRSEVCGNHTDHQNGKVIATAINLDMIAIVTPAEDIKVYSDDYDLNVIQLYDDGMKEEEKGTSEALIRGMVHGLRKAGYRIGGFHAFITSDVLQGSGMSSSAAFEVMIGTIISGLYNEGRIDPVEVAKIAQMSENVYYGKPCGLMDQCACAVGGLIYIDFKNEPRVERIDVNFSDFKRSLCIVDIHADHSDLTDEYASIPYEMKQVAKYMGADVLSQINEIDFYHAIDDLRKNLGDRPVLRAFHYFNEIRRVDDAVFALRYHDYETFKENIRASGDSSYKYLQNIYAPSDPSHQAMSLALGLSDKLLNGRGICRVHGGGFAGTIQVFVDDAIVESYREGIEKYFGKGSCHVLKIRNSGSVKVF